MVIVVDALRSDHLPGYGYPRETAPFLTRLAEEGFQLQGYSASSWTKTSVATLLTGLQPQRHGANGRYDMLPAAAPYLAEILSSRGYSTAGYSSNHFVGANFGFGRGFGAFPGVDLGFAARDTVAPLKPRAQRVTAIGLDLAAALETPFYLHLHYLDPHDPYVPERPWGRQEAIADYVQPSELMGRLRTLAADGPEVQRLIDQYDAAILETDRAIERLIGGLETMGLLEETLIVVTADHGEEFLEHGQLTHGKTLFDESLAVPFILWGQGVIEGYSSPAISHHVDFLPTVLRALGHDAPAGLDGRDLWDEIAGNRLPGDREHLFALEYTPGAAALALLSPPWKLIHRQKQPSLLFDLERDPTERGTLAGASELRERMLRQLIGRHNELVAGRLDSEQAQLAEETRDQLGALGYVGGKEADGGAMRDPVLSRPLNVFEARPASLFGDEDPSRFRSRLDPSRPSEQLLSGWWVGTPRGRWSRGEASLVFPAPSDGASLRLRGTAGHPVLCAVRIEGRQVASFELRSTGPFERSIVLPPATGSLLYIDLEVTPTRLSEQGGELGILWQEFSLHNGPEL